MTICNLAYHDFSVFVEITKSQAANYSVQFMNLIKQSKKTGHPSKILCFLNPYLGQKGLSVHKVSPFKFSSR